MKKIKCISPDETFFIFGIPPGKYACPICGSLELKHPPYHEDGTASFEMCTCGFEFGFDDCPFASKEAVEGIQANWKRWREKVIRKHSVDSDSLNALEKNLRNINLRLAYDLIPVEIEEDEDDGTNSITSLRDSTP